jgi:hypothetical protein
MVDKKMKALFVVLFLVTIVLNSPFTGEGWRIEVED